MYYIEFWIYIAAIVAGIYLLILTKRNLDAKISETKDIKETYKGILVIVASFVLASIVLTYRGETFELGRISFFVVIIPALAVIIYYWLSGLRWTGKIGEERVKQQTAKEEEVTSRIKLLNERARGLENKLEKIEWILRKVSD